MRDLYEATISHVHHLAMLKAHGNIVQATELVEGTYQRIAQTSATWREDGLTPLSWVLASTTTKGTERRPGKS